MDRVYSETARYYDKLYSGKDYAGEVARLRALIGEAASTEPQSLLDAACGTGRHIEHLKHHFRVQGLDICPELLDMARERNPDVSFHQGDLCDFELGERFDVVTCLFSSIGYVKTLDRLRSAVGTMVRHLNAGGLLIIEPWFMPENWHSNTVHASLVDEPELKIARVSTSFVEGRVSVFDLHHLIATPHGTEHVVEHHEMGLFTTDEMREVMEDAGLGVEYDAEGLTGRGLHVGTCSR